MFDTFDRTGAAEFPFPKEVVFLALMEAVKSSGMKINNVDKLSHRLDVSTGVSVNSWGEKISISVHSAGQSASTIAVASGAKTIFGSATTHGKNKKNVREILASTSRVLQRNGDVWLAECGHIREAVGESRAPSIADELGKLAALRDSGALTTQEFEIQKQKLLAK
jgi:hypothetical protein